MLRYRLPGEGWKNRETVPLQDAQRAMRLIHRDGSQVWHRSCAAGGVISSSAGGHLSASLAMRDGMKIDTGGRCRRHAGCQAAESPVTCIRSSLKGEGAHPGSRDKLLGETPSAEAVRNGRWKTCGGGYRTILHLPARRRSDRAALSPTASPLFGARCRRKKIASELHVFEAGGHGFSLHWTSSASLAATWPGLFLAWAAAHGFQGLARPSSSAL